MDIEKLYTVKKHAKGVEMQVKDESGKPLDMFLILAGVDSPVFRKGTIKAQRETLINDEANATAIALSEATIGWRGFMSKGKELKFSITKVQQLYENAPYIMDQVNIFIGKRANFTEG